MREDGWSQRNSRDPLPDPVIVHMLNNTFIVRSIPRGIHETFNAIGLARSRQDELRAP